MSLPEGMRARVSCLRFAAADVTAGRAEAEIEAAPAAVTPICHGTGRLGGNVRALRLR